MRVRLLAALLWMPLVASCFLFGPGRVGNPTAYPECADDEGRLAFAEAKVLLSAGKDRLALPLLQTAVTRCPDLVRAHLAYQDLAQRLGGKCPFPRCGLAGGLRWPRQGRRQTRIGGPSGGLQYPREEVEVRVISRGLIEPHGRVPR